MGNRSVSALCAGALALIAGFTGGSAAGHSRLPTASGGIAGSTISPFVPSRHRRKALVWAVGDGADGGARGLEVAHLIESQPPYRFIYLGDVYETGSAWDFEHNYRPLYGRFDAVAAPTLGNHEAYNRASGYDPYWERARGQPPPDWYSFSVAGWQFLSLDSMLPMAGGSSQVRWLEEELARTPRFGSCRIAFAHYPRYSGGVHGGDEALEPLWDALEGRARIFLSGHDHHMERFAPIGGITQFVAGAGGHALRDAVPLPETAFLTSERDGALRLRLRRGRAVASFVAGDGEVLDRSVIRCARQRRRG